MRTIAEVDGANALRRGGGLAKRRSQAALHAVGALLVGLMANYVAFLFPKMSLASNMLLMMAILLWRPFGLKPAVKG